MVGIKQSQFYHQTTCIITFIQITEFQEIVLSTIPF